MGLCGTTWGHYHHFTLYYTLTQALLSPCTKLILVCALIFADCVDIVLVLPGACACHRHRWNAGSHRSSIVFDSGYSRAGVTWILGRWTERSIQLTPAWFGTWDSKADPHCTPQCAVLQPLIVSNSVLDCLQLLHYNTLPDDLYILCFWCLFYIYWEPMSFIFIEVLALAAAISKSFYVISQ